MKCPKCGFNSFEFLDSCKKCGTALTPFKQNHGIRAVILPSRPAAVPPPAAGTGFVPGSGAPEKRADDFSREALPEVEPAGEPVEACSPPFPESGAEWGDVTFETFSFDEGGEGGESTPPKEAMLPGGGKNGLAAAEFDAQFDAEPDKH